MRLIACLTDPASVESILVHPGLTAEPHGSLPSPTRPSTTSTGLSLPSAGAGLVTLSRTREM